MIHTDQINELGLVAYAQEPLAPYSFFKIGGAAELLVKPTTTQELAAVVCLCKKTATDYTILGDGANCLISDRGLKGLVIITHQMKHIHIVGNNIVTDCGVRMSKLADTAMKAGLAGCEFASGIPGTIGGGIYMNAGAYDSQMSAIVSSAEVLHGTEHKTLSNDALGFQYRHSVLSTDDYTILSATFHLTPGDTQQINHKMHELNAKRRASQPLEYPSAGSIFKRPEGHFAGKLIQDAGLKGYKIGGAQISEKHAGFIINIGGATAMNVYQLIKHIQKTVLEHSGVMLEPEVRLLGAFECV